MPAEDQSKLEMDEKFIGGIKLRQKMAAAVIRNIVTTYEHVAEPVEFSALQTLIEKDVPRMLQEIEKLRTRT